MFLNQLDFILLNKVQYYLRLLRVIQNVIPLPVKLGYDSGAAVPRVEVPEVLLHNRPLVPGPGLQTIIKYKFKIMHF